MTSFCATCSHRPDALYCRVLGSISEWWNAYTVLHNLGLMEELLRRKRVHNILSRTT